MIIKYMLIVIVLSFLSCSKVTQNEQPQSDESNVTIIKEIEKPEIKIQYFERELIAKAAISGTMGRPIEDIKVETSGDIYLVSYIRQDDNQFFSYKVKIEGNRIIWGSSDGRWRDTKYDQKITFTETKDQLKIKELYTDGSFSSYDFTLKDFN